MKFKQYLCATAAVQQRDGLREEYVVLRNGIDGIKIEHVFDSEDDALEFSNADDYLYARAKREFDVAVNPYLLRSSDEAMGRIRVNRECVCEDDGSFKADIIAFGSNYLNVTTDSDDWDEYRPRYEVTLNAKLIREITVEIDPEECDEPVDDEYDAARIAISKADNGDYDYEIEHACDDYVEFEERYTEEI